MTFWQTLYENRTKILGTATTLVAGLLSAIALGMFSATATDPALLDPSTIRWMTVVLSILNMVLGGGTVAVGVQNTTRERVAEAQAVTATKVVEALNTTPPPAVVVMPDAPPPAGGG